MRGVTNHLAPFGAALAGVLVLVGAGAPAAALVVVLLAVLLARRDHGPWTAETPAALVLLTGGALVVAQGAALVDVPVLRGGWWLRAALALGCLVLAVALRRPSHTDRDPDPHRDAGDVSRLAGALVGAPAALVVVVGAVSLAVDGWGRFAWLVGGDHVRHLVMVSSEVREGYLSYADQTYPRAWHTLVALAWSPVGDRDTPAALVTAMDVLTASTWLVSAGMALAVGALARSVARRLGAGEAPSAVAGLVAGTVMLWPGVLRPVLAYGFETVPLALIALVAGCLAVLRRPRPTRRDVVVAAVAVAVVAHTWHLLLPASVLLAATTVWTAEQTARRTRRALAAAVAAVVAVATATPSVAAALRGIGVAHATQDGVIFDYPLVAVLLVGAGTGALAVVALRRPTGPDRALLAVAAAVVGTVLSGPVLAVLLGVPASSYYPTKLSWLGVLLGVPLVCVALVGPGLRLWSAGVVARGGLVATASLLLLVGAATPVAAALGIGAQARVDDVLAAATVPGAQRSQVVWQGPASPEDHTDAVARTLLDFYRAPTLRQQVVQDRLTVAAECTLLTAQPVPVILSDQPSDAVRSRYACAPGLTVLAPAGLTAGHAGTGSR